MIADVNWLLSAVAQSSAALIAIVGGLLVSRYVTLHAEQQAALRRVDDLRRREDEAAVRLGKARRALARHEVEQALEDDDVYAAVLDADFEPSVSDLVESTDVDVESLDRMVLIELLEDLAGDVKRAAEVLGPLVSRGAQHRGWSEFRKQHQLQVGRRDVWAWIYDGFVDARKEEHRREEEEARRRSSPYGSLTPALDIASTLQGFSFVSPEVSGLRRVVDSQQEIAVRTTHQNDIEGARIEQRGLEQERRLAEETRDATRQPEGFGLALQVLTVLAVVGLAFPVVVMGAAPVHLPAVLRWVVVGCFLAGVGLLLRFLFVYASSLRQGGRESLPTTVWGLLRRR